MNKYQLALNKINDILIARENPPANYRGINNLTPADWYEAEIMIEDLQNGNSVHVYGNVAMLMQKLLNN